MNVKQIKKDLLKSIRGKKSQTQVSRRLGYSFNQVYRWESELTRLTWSDFVKLCDACKVDLKGALKNAFEYSGDPQNSALIIQHIIGTEKITHLSRAIKISRFVLSDWAKGKSDPPLDSVLELLKHRDEIYSFIESLVDIESFPALTKESKTKRKALTFFYENPIASAAIMTLEISSYRSLSKHSFDFIAKKVGISAEECKSLFAKMEELQLVRKENGKYVRTESIFNSRGDFAGERKLRTYWMQKGIEVDQKRTKLSDKNHFGFLLFPADETKRALVLEAYRHFANTLANINSEDTNNGDQIMVATIQFFGLDDFL